MYTDKHNYSFKCMHTQIIVHIVLHIVDIHEKGIITQIEVCILNIITRIRVRFFYFSNKLHLSKICLCCFLVIHLYSNNLSTIATIS